MYNMQVKNMEGEACAGSRWQACQNIKDYNDVGGWRMHDQMHEWLQ